MFGGMLGRIFCAAVAVITAAFLLAASTRAWWARARKPRQQGQHGRHLVLDAAEHAERLGAVQSW